MDDLDEQQSEDKEVVPTATMTWIGIMLDTAAVQLRMWVSRAKITDILQLCRT